LTSRSVIVAVALLFFGAASAQASAESARLLKNGIHFFGTGDLVKSKRYFTSVLSLGTPEERSLARRYLATAALKNLSSSQDLVNDSLRRGISLYKAGKFEDAFKTFSGVLESGNPNQAAIAQSYLNRPELRDLGSIAEDQEPTLEENSDALGPGLRLSGFIRNDTALRVSAPQQLSMLQNYAYAAGTGQIGPHVSYKISGRLYYDAVYDITSNYPRPVADDQRSDAMVRDTYLDISEGDWDLRAGKQQIVWGEAVAIFYADVVNGKDLREFVLPDFETIRIPEWGTDLEYQKNNLHAEFVWIPVPEMDLVGRPGSEYAFVQPPTPPGVAVAWGPAEDPSRTLSNSELGGRFSYRAGGWDVGVFHLYTWDKAPVYTSTIQQDTLFLTETHPRITFEGATFSKEVEDVVLKGEFVYSGKKYFQSTDPAMVDGINPKAYADYLLGADYTFQNNVSATFQAGQRVIQDYTSDLFQQKPSQTTFTLSLKRSFLDNRVEPEFLILYDITTGDNMIRPRISYKFATDWKWTVGADFFDGPPDGLFGEFSNRNRVYEELRFDF